MRKNKGITDEIRLSYLKEYMSSSMSPYGFEKKKGLSFGTIRYWIRIFGFSNKPSNQDMNTNESSNEKDLKDEIQSLKRQIKVLEVELKESNMARDAYDCMIDLAEKTYNIPVRKNSDAK